MYEHIPENPYLLLTPGPLSTSKGVRNALLRDWCTWDSDYNEDIVQNIRRRLVALATKNTDAYTVVLMQGSGSFGVEATLGSAVPAEGKVLVLSNGAYGARMAKMAQVLGLRHTVLTYPETEAPKPEDVAAALENDPEITHVSFVHCETTTGILNPLEALAGVVKRYGKILIVDAMSSFGGIPMDLDALGIDFLISSSNKCIQGVPGFCFVLAKKDRLAACKGNARSLCLDLYDQWLEMDATGKWRFTSPTHIVRAFYQALDELAQEGGVAVRYARYCENQSTLSQGMRALGFTPLLPQEVQSPIITSFLYPTSDFAFHPFYQTMKQRGFVLYPGKISNADTFRIGNIGDVYPADIVRLLETIGSIA
jgi:2-aminoethylphosphonate-pyruvate transaminase